MSDLSTRTLLSFARGRFLIALEWKLSDLWVGVFFTRTEAWICLVPCLPIHIHWNRMEDERPFVCPSCYAVGAEPCAPDCIDAEIAREEVRARERGDHGRMEDDEEDA